MVAFGHQPVADVDVVLKFGHQPVATDESCAGLWLLAETAAEPVMPASRIAAAARRAAKVLFMLKLLICVADATGVIEVKHAQYKE